MRLRKNSPGDTDSDVLPCLPAAICGHGRFDIVVVRTLASIAHLCVCLVAEWKAHTHVRCFDRSIDSIIMVEGAFHDCRVGECLEYSTAVTIYSDES